jgi:hypothetical protein
MCLCIKKNSSPHASHQRGTKTKHKQARQLYQKPKIPEDKMRESAVKIAAICLFALFISGCKNTQIECMKHIDQEIERKITEAESQIVFFAQKHSSEPANFAFILDDPRYPKVLINRTDEDGNPNFVLVLPNESPYLVTVNLESQSIASASEQSGLALKRKQLNSERIALQKTCR